METLNQVAETIKSQPPVKMFEIINHEPPNQDEGVTTSPETNVAEEVPEPVRLGQTSISSVPIQHSDLSFSLRSQEWTRVILATGLLIYLGLIILGTGLYIFFNRISFNEKFLQDEKFKVSLQNEKFREFIQTEIKEQRTLNRELITLIWTSQVTLVGSALGFYFGQNLRKDK